MGEENLAGIQVEGTKVTSLLDSGSRVNTIVPGFVEKLDLPVYPLEDLVGNLPLTLVGVGGCRTRPKGFVIVKVQVDEVAGYNEEQIALVVPDESEFAARVPIILGTPALKRIINVMKESELDKLSTPWAQARISTALSQARVNSIHFDPEIPHKLTTTNDKNARDLDEIAYARSSIQLPPLSHKKVKLRINTQLQGYKANVCVSPLEDTSDLPLGVEIDESFNVLNSCSNVVLASIRNESGDHVTIHKGQAVARVTLGNEEPSSFISKDVFIHLQPQYATTPTDEDIPVRSNQPTMGTEKKEQSKPRMTEEERKKNLLNRLDLSGLDDWDEEDAKNARALLAEFHDIFSLEALELGETKVAEHEIKLNNSEPFKERFRRIPPPLMEEVRSHIKEMLDAGVISPSNSPWSNAVVLVRKKDGSLRFCIDFRRLNNRTVQDAYQLPRITETLDLLRGMSCFSCLDLKSGFWQIPMALSSRPYTAFTVGNLGFFECNRMPFGLTNAPATFQRAMEECMGELNLAICLVYLDDLITYSKNNPDHLVRLRQVFEKLRDSGLKLKPEKCKMFQKEITYLGHKVSKEGIRPSDENIEAIKNLKKPETYTEIRGFVSCVGHYRRFIRNFAALASGLYDHLKGDNAKKKKENVKLSPDGEASYTDLVDAITTAPVLIPADFTRPFRLETDASKKGLGAVLSQPLEKGDKVYHPISFGSSVLKKSQQFYHSSKLEFFALFWAVTKQFKEYLYHTFFTVRTDNNPLTYITTTAKLDAVGHRWVAQLANYKFSLEYVRGCDNVVADCLSRNVKDPVETDDLPKNERLLPPNNCELSTEEAIPPAKCEPGIVSIPEKGVQNLLSLDNTDCDERAAMHDPFLVQLRQSIQREEEIIAEKARPMIDVQVSDWKSTQEEDPAMKAVMQWLRNKKNKNKPAPSLATVLGPELASTPEGQTYLKHQKNFKLHKNLLYHKTRLTWLQSNNDYLEALDSTLAFVVPPKLRPVALTGCHDGMGHQGRDRTLSLLKERFWWPTMHQDMVKRIKECKRCILRKGAKVRAPLKPIIATGYLDLVHVDFTSMETNIDPKSTTGTKNVLVMQDHFTKFLVLRVTKDQTAATVAHHLWYDFCSILGIPNRLISDQGASFTGGLIREMCHLLGIQKLNTTPYHPMGNGQVERANRTIFNLIGTLQEDQKAQWEKHLPMLQYAYNTTRSTVTGYSPHYLVYKLIPRIPIDFRMPTLRPDDARKNYEVRRMDKMVAEDHCRMHDAYQVVNDSAKREAARQQRYYDYGTTSVALRSGDIVLVLANAFKGKRKLMDTWQEKTYTVLDRVGDDNSPNYRIADDDGNQQILHRNRLYLLEPADPVGLSLSSRATDIRIYTTDTALQDEPMAVTASAKVQKEDTPKDDKPVPVRNRLLGHPVGWLGERPRGSPWTTQKLSQLDQTSGYVGSITVIAARNEEG